MVEKSLILKYEVKFYTFLLFFFFTVHFKFQNMVLISFFFQNIIAFGHPNYRCPKSIYWPPNQSRIVPDMGHAEPPQSIGQIWRSSK